MKRFLLSLVVLAVLPCGAPCQDSNANVDAAKAVWESVIAAKGGRERLVSVRTLGVRLDGGRDWYQMFAFAFPSKLWRRTGPIETLVIAADAERGTEMSASRYYPNPHKSRKQVEESTSVANADSAKLLVNNEVCNAVTWYLLETSWYQPTVTGLEEVVRDSKPAFVIYVDECKGKGAYVIDKETRLPIEYVGFINAVRRKGAPRINDGFPHASFPLGDYAPVEGIMLPRRFEKAKMTYEVNRDYGDSLFTTAPKLSDWGPWPRR